MGSQQERRSREAGSALIQMKGDLDGRQAPKTEQHVSLWLGSFPQAELELCKKACDEKHADWQGEAASTSSRWSEEVDSRRI